MPHLWMWVKGHAERPNKETGKGGAAPLLARRILGERLGRYDWRISCLKVED